MNLEERVHFKASYLELSKKLSSGVYLYQTRKEEANMDIFDQAVKGAEARRAAPVAGAKEALAPLRAEAEKVLREFNALATRLRPGLEVARTRLQQAASVGVRSPQLERYLKEAFGDGGVGPGILLGAPAGLRDLMNRIDQLTEWQVYQGIHIRLPGLLPGLRAASGVLEKLAEAVEAGVAALPELIERAHAVPSVVVVERPERPPAIPVEHEFKP